MKTLYKAMELSSKMQHFHNKNFVGVKIENELLILLTINN